MDSIEQKSARFSQHHCRSWQQLSAKTDLLLVLRQAHVSMSPPKSCVEATIAMQGGNHGLNVAAKRSNHDSPGCQSRVRMMLHHKARANTPQDDCAVSRLSYMFLRRQ